LKRKKKQPAAAPAATSMPLFNFNFGGDFASKPAESNDKPAEKNEVSSQPTPALSKPLFDFSFNAGATLDKPATASSFAQFANTNWNFTIGSGASQDSEASANSSSATPAWADASYTPSEDAPQTQRDTYVVSDEVKEMLAKEPPKSGEEDEKNIAQVTAKLFVLSKKEAEAAASDDKKEGDDAAKKSEAADKSSSAAAMEWREL